MDWGLTGQYKGSRQVAGHRNDFVLGVNYFDGNKPGQAVRQQFRLLGALTNDNTENSSSVEVYGENWFYVAPTVSSLPVSSSTGRTAGWSTTTSSTGTIRARDATSTSTPRSACSGSQARASSFRQRLARLRATGLERAQPQRDARLRRSRAQTSWTAEIGTRGTDRGNSAWDLSLYRSWVAG